MNDERKRILRMLAEGQVSVDECDELLRAFSERKAERMRQEKQRATQGKRPVWPYLLLALLAVWVLALYGVLGQIRGWLPFYAPRLPMPLTSLFWPGFAGILGLALFVFWIVMLIDCIRREPVEFRLLFTQNFRSEKWIWLAIIVLGQLVGALVYLLAVRQPRRSALTGEPPDAEGAEQQSFVPRARARALWPWVVVWALLCVLPSLLTKLIFGFQTRGLDHAFSSLALGHVSWSMVVRAPLALLPALVLVFWLWMLIDCLSRDYREFGTLITGDRSADKLLWLGLILFLPIAGAVAYHVGVRRRPPELRGAERA